MVNVLNSLKITFDNGIQSVNFSYGANEHTFTTSGEQYGFSPEPGSDITLTINLKSGYSLKSSSLGSVSGNIVTIPFSTVTSPTEMSCTLVSEAATVKKSVDLTTLSGWANLAPGNHTIKIVAKGTGYRDSEKSAGVVVNKQATVTYDNVTLVKVNYNGQTQGSGYAGAGYNQITNADKTKYYIVVIGSDSNNLYYYGYLAWDNTKSMWSLHDIYNPEPLGDGCKIVADKSNETRIVFGFGDVGAAFSNWFDVAVCVSSTTEPDSTTDYATIFSAYPKQSASYWTCFIEGTLITLADGTKKPVEDITYNDDILCWDFYKGELTSAKPAWITTVHIANCYNLCKFSNEAEIGFVGMGGTEGYHRIYNDEAKAFTHTGVVETPIGTTTFAEDGTFPKLVKQQIVKKDVKFYNIGTEKHFNLFTNGILTSSRISNMYAIKDMKYYGEQLIGDDEINEYIEAKRNY
jgi:hypothetical protein